MNWQKVYSVLHSVGMLFSISRFQMRLMPFAFSIGGGIGVRISWHYLKPNKPNKPRQTKQTRRADHLTTAKLKLFKDSNQPQQRVDPHA